MPLSDAKLRTAKAADRPYKLPDGRGLYLLVMPSGLRSWKYRWERAGRERTVALGDYPKMGLAAARDARDAARMAIRNGVTEATPKAGEAFESVARRWHAQNADRWADRHADDVLSSMARDLFPEIGRSPIDALDAPTVLAALRKIEARGSVETARRIAQRAGMVFVFAIGEGIASINPAATVRPALRHPTRGRQPAIVALDDLRTMLRAAEAQPAHPTTRLALRLLALTAVRPGAITGATWREFESLEGLQPVWRVPEERMKGRVGAKIEHVAPLAPAAVEVMRAAHTITGRAPLVFPSVRNARKPMSGNAIGYLLHRAGYHGHHVPHGFRAAFSTIMNERFPADRAVIDLMLAHTPANAVESAYNRAEHAKRRRELAEEWAGLLMDGARPAAELLGGARR